MIVGSGWQDIDLRAAALTVINTVPATTHTSAATIHRFHLSLLCDVEFSMHSGKSAERYDKLLGSFGVLDLNHDVVAVGLLEVIGLLSVHQ